MLRNAATKYTFGHLKLDSSQVFHASKLSYATVNLKPIVPGHVLVIPHRKVARVEQMTAEELSDLMLTGQRVSRMLKGKYRASAFTFSIQDGEDAGQSVSHVHLHVLPRKKGDFPHNDDIYTEMDKFDFPADDDDRKKTSATAAAVPSPPSFSPSAAAAPEKSVRMDADDDRKPRSREEMTEEADDFRGLMQALDE